MIACQLLSLAIGDPRCRAPAPAPAHRPQRGLTSKLWGPTDCYAAPKQAIEWPPGPPGSSGRPSPPARPCPRINARRALLKCGFKLHAELLLPAASHAFALSFSAACCFRCRFRCRYRCVGVCGRAVGLLRGAHEPRGAGGGTAPIPGFTAGFTAVEPYP